MEGVTVSGCLEKVRLRRDREVGYRCADRTFFRRVASGPRFAAQDPNAQVASLQRDAVSLLPSDA